MESSQSTPAATAQVQKQSESLEKLATELANLGYKAEISQEVPKRRPTQISTNETNHIKIDTEPSFDETDLAQVNELAKENLSGLYTILTSLKNNIPETRVVQTGPTVIITQKQNISHTPREIAEERASSL